MQPIVTPAVTAFSTFSIRISRSTELALSSRSRSGRDSAVGRGRRLLPWGGGPDGGARSRTRRGDFSTSRRGIETKPGALAPRGSPARHHGRVELEQPAQRFGRAVPGARPFGVARLLGRTVGQVEPRLVGARQFL